MCFFFKQKTAYEFLSGLVGSEMGIIDSYMDGNSPGSGYFLLGLIITLARAAVQQSGFTIHKQFNHNDLYHVIQMAGIWYIYKGGIILRFLQPLQN